MDIDRKTLPSSQEMLRDIPVYGPAMGAPNEFIEPILDDSGSPIEVEQVALDLHDPADYAQRPPALARKSHIYAVFVSGNSMEPRYRNGEAAIVDSKRPPMIGDDVVVQLRGPNGQDGEERITSVLIKTLVRRSASFVELQQYNPPLTFRIDTARVRHLHRVIPIQEILGI